MKSIDVAVIGEMMRFQFGKKQSGVTLLEMMLVSVIIGSLFVMFAGLAQQRTRTIAIDRASQQVQQILNAALSYYVVNGDWPSSLGALQAPTPYIPTPFTSPWNTAYSAAPILPTAPSVRSLFFQVTAEIPVMRGTDAIAAILAGKLPFGSVIPGVSGTARNVTSYVLAPGPNVNNARAANFAGLYKNGACVPVPACPSSDASGKLMAPEILLTPVSVSGANVAGSTDVYPLTSFTAYASGPPAAVPLNCTSAAASPVCDPSTSPTGRFWRACVQVTTAKGTIDWTDTILPPVIMAMTRCIVQDEQAGSPFSVFGP